MGAEREWLPLRLLCVHLHLALAEHAHTGHADGAVYSGRSNAQDEAHGHGVYALPDGHVYRGEWKSNRAVGHGVKHYPDGTVYRGQWADGEREG